MGSSPIKYMCNLSIEKIIKKSLLISILKFSSVILNIYIHKAFLSCVNLITSKVVPFLLLLLLFWVFCGGVG